MRDTPLYASRLALSARLAEDVLKAADFPSEKVPHVLQAITEHDQPDLRPTTVEGRILKDADFLAGMGATGIARASMWTGEMGGSLGDLIGRLANKLPARIRSLEFPESRRLAMKEYVFVALFLSKLQAQPLLEPSPTVPYVVFEGISGTGKSTQVDMLSAHFSQLGLAPVVIREPTAWFRQMSNSLKAVHKGVPGN